MTWGRRQGAGGHVLTSGRSSRVLAVTIAVASVCLAAALPLVLSSCSLSTARDPAADQSRTLELAGHQFSEAAGALREGDRDSFLRWLPTDGSPGSVKARDGLADVFDTLSRLPWRSFRFEVTPIDARPGVYRVVGSGQLGAAGPPDRLAVVRYLKLSPLSDAAVVAGDETPQAVRRRYLMALHDPVVLQRPGLIVLADHWARERAGEVLAAAARARPRLAGLGAGTKGAVLITVYGSVEDVRDALGTDAATARLVFFSYPSLRVADADWPIWDVAVMGPWLRGSGSIDDTVAHELAHAYTLQWFDGVEHPPSLLVEGIAESVEDAPVSAALRREVASGDQLWPLPESFAVADVWEGGKTEDVGLGYDLGASLVDYVVSRWGAGKLRPFAQSVAAAEPTEAGMDAALGDSLGVTWRRFYAGWRRYVLAGG
jgi:hypothetical protein